MSAHAMLSASGAERWLNCPASARLEEGLPDSESVYAAEGTLAHKLAELRLRKQYVEPMGPGKLAAALKQIQDDPLYTSEMPGHIETYFDYVADTIHRYPSPPYIAIERRLDFSHIVPGGFGTGDCIIIGGDELRVIDFKYGRGVVVEAGRNPQMMLYALGALKHYGLLYPIRRVRMAVVQPRVEEPVKEWDASASEIVDWGESIRAAAKLAYGGGGPANAGEWCRFCRAKAQCRERSERMLETERFAAVKPPLMSNGEIGEILGRAQALAQWAEDLKDYAEAALLKGENVPGWKLVEGRSNRAFVDVDRAFKAIISAGTDENMLYERKPITLTAVEKLLGKKAFGQIAEPYVIKPQGKPTIAPESDTRKPFERTQASDIFKPVSEVPGATLVYDQERSTI